MTRHGALLFAVVLSILLSAVSEIVPAPAGGAVSQAVGPEVNPTAATLLSGPVTGVTPGTFWGVNLQTRCASCIWSDQAIKTFLNQTPFVYSTNRYGAMSDQCNVTSDTQWSSNGVPSSGCAYNVTSLKSWCYSFTPHCHVILDLPGENNNSGQIANIANYIVNVLGFQPDFWSIGNEPTAWNHYGIAWPNWRSTDASHATPTAYAYDVKAGIAAVLSVDPSAKFIGIEAATQANTAWFQSVLQVDGDSLSAVAYHTYPSVGSATPTLAQFLAPLDSNNITSSYATVRAAMVGQCSTCATMPIFVNEYNAGPGSGASSLGGTYSNAVFLAASVAQALRANVSMFTIFNLESSSATYGFSMMNSTDTVGPTGLLFSKLMPYLTTGTTESVGIQSAATGIWSVKETGGSFESLLVVNANLTQGINLTVGSVFPTGGSGTIATWAGGAAPTVVTGTIPTFAVIPSQGMLVFEITQSTPSNGGGGGGGGGGICIGIACPGQITTPSTNSSNATGTNMNQIGKDALIVGGAIAVVGLIVLAILRNPWVLVIVLAGGVIVLVGLGIIHFWPV